jgi:ribulose-bisphosphate carboxylase large chain
MSSPMPRSEFRARYLVESSVPVAQAAEVIAGEQSSGTFVRLPGETDELRERAAARVTAVHALPPLAQPSLHSAHAQRRGQRGPFHRGEVEIAFPVANVGANLPALLATVAGNLFELGEITGLRLLDIDLPPEHAAQFAGPQFGIEGTRRLAGVHGRPLIGSIIKPSIGLLPEATAAVVEALCSADIDFIKDDELLVDPVYARFEARLRAVMPVLHRHADRIGRMPMYAINLSGTIDEMRRRHDAVLAMGGTCVMVSINWVGYSGVEHLRSHSQLPIHGHRNGWGALTRHPALGFEFAAYQKLWRLAGVDHLHVNGLRGKFWEPDASVIASARACLQVFSGVRPLMPVFSSGQWGGQAPDMYAALGCTDLMHLAGGGIIGHPHGIAAGVTGMRQAWEAAVSGASLEAHASTRPALRAAIDTPGTHATPARGAVGTDLLLAYYGDDFTGSTDALEALTQAGVPTVLFLKPPDAGGTAALSRVRAVGVAGTSRSRDPAWMRRAPGACAGRAGRPGRAGAALQGLLHLRLLAHHRLHRLRHRPGRAADAGRLVAHASSACRALGRWAFGHLFAVAPRARASGSTATRPCRGTRSRRWASRTSSGTWRARRRCASPRSRWPTSAPTPTRRTAGWPSGWPRPPPRLYPCLHPRRAPHPPPPTRCCSTAPAPGSSPRSAACWTAWRGAHTRCSSSAPRAWNTR